MRSQILILALLVLAVIPTGCSEDRAVAPDSSRPPGGIDAATVAQALISHFAWTVDPEAGSDAAATPKQSVILSAGREIVTGAIAHYHAVIATGPDPHDLVRIHRVIEEVEPGQPIAARSAVFFQHGDCKSFVTTALPGTVLPSTPREFGMATHLAGRGIDVWGIDHAWCDLPQCQPDFDFMADWDLQRAVDDLDLAIATARLTRQLTGHGLQKLHLCAYCGGVTTGWALLDQQATLPAAERTVGGFITLDSIYVTDDPWVHAFFRQQLDTLPDTPQSYSGMHDLGHLALDFPDSPSPYDPTLTNLEYVLQTMAAPEYGTPTFHYWAGSYDPAWVGGDEPPVDFRYTDLTRVLEYLDASSCWSPTARLCDELILRAGEGESPYDDNLAAIQNPLLQIAAGGGYSELAFETGARTASSDVTELVIRLQADGDACLDLGHCDLVTSDLAPALVWDEMVRWIRVRSRPQPGEDRTPVRDLH
jgi:hypothetical protein